MTRAVCDDGDGGQNNATVHHEVLPHAPAAGTWNELIRSIGPLTAPPTIRGLDDGVAFSLPVPVG
ncbi:hypothetical protein [Streptomyces sp. NPDC096193]|uniref:hypothetical protein n=1 Tax=Streptomyces sp. NPDC096193 TaxID=3155821 RepID=UPI00333266BE